MVFVLIYGNSALFIVYPLALGLSIKTLWTACPSGQVSGGFILVLVEQDVAQSEQLEFKEAGRSE